jgi:hypothetical protein
MTDIMTDTEVRAALLKRGFNLELGYNYHIGEGVATFMLFGVRGFIENDNKLLGYQAYRHDVLEKRRNTTDSRYYTHHRRCNIIDDTVVFGLELLEKNAKTLFITEGIFEAATLHRLGYNAIAILTSAPNKRMRKYIPMLADKSVWCGDSDAAGNGSWLSRACDYRLCFPDRDLDEIPYDEIHEAINDLLG